MNLEFIKYEKRGHVAYLTINRPERRNALHPPANAEMAQAMDDFAADKAMWVAIMTGAGDKAFSAGNDLRWTAENPDKMAQMVPPKSGFGGMTSRFDLFKPVIAAVNGYALGGGFEIALACDIIVAADHAEFGLPEPRVGLMALAGGVHRLPRQIPLKIAMGMMLAGKRIPAPQAHALGVVNEVVPLKDLMATAERWANEIMECSPASVRATKECAMGGLGMPLNQALEKHYEGITKLFRSPDVIEGPLAFAQKRKPNWSGE